MGGEGDIMEEDEDAAAMAMTTTGTDRTRYTREERDLTTFVRLQYQVRCKMGNGRFQVSNPRCLGKFIPLSDTEGPYLVSS